MLARRPLGRGPRGSRGSFGLIGFSEQAPPPTVTAFRTECTSVCRVCKHRAMPASGSSVPRFPGASWELMTSRRRTGEHNGFAPGEAGPSLPSGRWGCGTDAGPGFCLGYVAGRVVRKARLDAGARQWIAQDA